MKENSELEVRRGKNQDRAAGVSGSDLATFPGRGDAGGSVSWEENEVGDVLPHAYRNSGESLRY